MLDLSKIVFNASPNFGSRCGQKITHIILHCPSGTDEGALATLKSVNNPAGRVSAHYLIQRNGTPIQLVKLEDAAWHAMHQPNMWSVGIEIVDRYVNNGQLTADCRFNKQWITKPELDTLVQLVTELMQKFNIPLANVLGHNDPWLKQFGNNHVDPGPFFPWKDFRNQVTAKIKLLEIPQELIDSGHAALLTAGIPEPHYLSVDVNQPSVKLPTWNPLAKKSKQ